MDCDIDFTDQLLMAWLMAGRPKHVCVCVRAQCVKIWQLPICGFFSDAVDVSKCQGTVSDFESPR